MPAHLSRVTLQNEFLDLAGMMTRHQVLAPLRRAVNAVEPQRPCTLAWSPVLQGFSTTERGSDGMVVMMAAPYRQLAREGTPLRMAGIGIQAGTRDGRREPHLVVCDADQWMGPQAPMGQDARYCAHEVASRSTMSERAISRSQVMLCRSAGLYRDLGAEAEWDAPRVGYRHSQAPDLVQQWQRIKTLEVAQRELMDMPSMAHLAWCLGAFPLPRQFAGMPKGQTLIEALADEYCAVVEGA